MRAPAGVVVAVVAGAVAGVAGLGVPGAVGVGVLGWIASVVVGLLWRSPRPATPDPFAVGEPWRRYVSAAIRHQRRFAEACGATPDGPLRARLEGLGTRVDDAVAEVWEIAQAGNRLSRARRAIGTTPPHSTGPAAAEPAAPTGEIADGTVDARSIRDEASGRLEETIGTTQRQLAALDAQLGAVVTRAIEVSAAAGANADFGLVEGDLGQLLDEMEALRLALGELGTAGPGDGPERTEGDGR